MFHRRPCDRGSQDCSRQTAGGFKTVTDIMNWPRIIGSVTAIELLTRGRVRVGTRVRLIRIMYGRQMTEELEVETFERPRGLRLV
jgi:hypothetical protein